MTYDEYLSVYGYLPYGYHIEGFILGEESVLEITKIEDNKYHLVIDGEIGSANVKKQMRKFGNLTDYPKFSLVYMDITLNNDFSPVEIHFYAEYETSYQILGSIKCVQDYVVTYSYGKDIS